MAQAWFSFVESRPLCSGCQRRCARRRDDGTFAKLCARCQAKYLTWKRKHYAQEKVAVLVALGGRCQCTLPDCWHPPSACPVAHLEALTVHHANGDGWKDRRLSADRTRLCKHDALRWTRYRQRLAEPDHGLSLWCAACHQIETTREQRVRRQGRGCRRAVL